MADHAADPGHADPNMAAAAAAAAANQWASGLAAGNPYLPQVSIFNRHFKQRKNLFFKYLTA
jgi:hypothetical protein